MPSWPHGWPRAAAENAGSLLHFAFCLPPCAFLHASPDLLLHLLGNPQLNSAIRHCLNTGAEYYCTLLLHTYCRFQRWRKFNKWRPQTADTDTGRNRAHYTLYQIRELRERSDAADLQASNKYQLNLKARPFCLRRKRPCFQILLIFIL